MDCGTCFRTTMPSELRGLSREESMSAIQFHSSSRGTFEESRVLSFNEWRGIPFHKHVNERYTTVTAGSEAILCTGHYRLSVPAMRHRRMDVIPFTSVQRHLLTFSLGGTYSLELCQLLFVKVLFSPQLKDCSRNAIFTTH